MVGVQAETHAKNAWVSLLAWAILRSKRIVSQSKRAALNETKARHSQHFSLNHLVAPPTIEDEGGVAVGQFISPVSPLSKAAILSRGFKRATHGHLGKFPFQVSEMITHRKGVQRKVGNPWVQIMRHVAVKRLYS